MDNYVALARAVLVAAVVFAPRIAWRVYQRCRYSQAIRDFVPKPFACPNCGHRFYTRQRLIHPVSENKAYLKCPSCGKRDLRGRPYDFDPDDP